jgi:hypothetical protein
MPFRGSMITRLGAGTLAGAAALVLGACDTPTTPAGGRAAMPAGPSMLINAACAGEGGQEHPFEYIATTQTWTRANSPHRVTGTIYVNGGRVVIAPGAVVCFDPGTGMVVQNGGRLHARGRDTAQIVLTAREPGWGWQGLQFIHYPAGMSYLTNVRMEHVGINAVAISTGDGHGVYADSAVIRQSGVAVRLYSPGSRLLRSRVDTTTNRLEPAVDLSNGARFEQTVVRGAAGTGVRVYGLDVLLRGGRIEGSGGTGLVVRYERLNAASTAVRVTGGRGYPVDMGVDALALLYPTPALQDSLAGNARDTLVISGGLLHRATLTVGPRLPLRLTSWVHVDSAGMLAAQPGARISFDAGGLVAQNGGRVYSRGSAASPVVLTADHPPAGWAGVSLYGGGAAATSYFTNTRIEHVGLYNVAVSANGTHRAIIDSAVIRYSGRGVSLFSPNSRLMRTRVDTTLNGNFPAVELGSNARIESTLIRAPAGTGLRVAQPTVVVASCEVRDGDGDGIVVEQLPMTLRNCNLVNNRGVGVRSQSWQAVTATGLWWGSTGGPNGPGGDGVAGTVTFTPWRTTPYVLPYVP